MLAQKFSKIPEFLLRTEPARSLLYRPVCKPSGDASGDSWWRGSAGGGKLRTWTETPQPPAERWAHKILAAVNRACDVLMEGLCAEDTTP